MNHIISARDANQQFSKLLRQVEEGDEVVITRRGAPVARLTPAGDQAAQRARALQDLQDFLRQPFDLGGEPFDRETLYDR